MGLSLGKLFMEGILRWGAEVVGRGLGQQESAGQNEGYL